MRRTAASASLMPGLRWSGQPERGGMGAAPAATKTWQHTPRFLPLVCWWPCLQAAPELKPRLLPHCHNQPHRPCAKATVSALPSPLFPAAAQAAGCRLPAQHRPHRRQRALLPLPRHLRHAGAAPGRSRKLTHTAAQQAASRLLAGGSCLLARCASPAGQSGSAAAVRTHGWDSTAAALPAGVLAEQVSHAMFHTTTPSLSLLPAATTCRHRALCAPAADPVQAAAGGGRLVAARQGTADAGGPRGFGARSPGPRRQRDAEAGGLLALLVCVSRQQGWGPGYGWQGLRLRRS